MTDLFLGFTQDDPFQKVRRVTLGEAERIKTHMLVVGSPGSGKSKFLEWMARGDIRNRQGLCILDIHGALYNDVRRWCAYKHFLTRNVVMLDPSKGEYIKGFNPFRRKKDPTRPGQYVDVDVQVDAMVQALLRVWGAENTNETPTLDRVLRLLFTAMVEYSIPLHDAFYLINFDQHDLREDVIANFAQPVVQAAWRQIQDIKRRGDWRGEVLSTENRLYKLVSSPTMQRFMGVLDESFNLDLLDIMNRGHILLVNLKESGRLSESNARAFGALLVNDLFKTAIMFRDSDLLKHHPPPFYLYIDEWQNIITPDIKKILAQARKFGLILILANQDLSQIQEAFSQEFVNTLMTCCQIKACFGGSNRSNSLRMTDEMLVGQIDLNESKYEIWSTKFWPKYQRDYVRTTTTFSSKSSGGAIGEVSGVTQHYAWIDGAWVAAPATVTETSTSVQTSGTMNGQAESNADIPILIPVPFKEVTGKATYSLDEQRWRWSDQLMEQMQRHCFIKIPGEKTIPMLVPIVRDHVVLNAAVADYERKVAGLIAAKSPAQVDAALKQQTALLGPPKADKPEVSSTWDWEK